MTAFVSFGKLEEMFWRLTRISDWVVFLSRRHSVERFRTYGYQHGRSQEMEVVPRKSKGEGERMLGKPSGDELRKIQHRLCGNCL